MRDRRALALTTCGAFFGPFLGVSLSLVAVQNTRAGVAATLLGLTPVLILPLAIFVRKERVLFPKLCLALRLPFGGHEHTTPQIHAPLDASPLPQP